MAMTGVASTMMRLVEYIDQMNSGSRNQVMPGARILWTVTMKFSPVRMELNPAMKMPTMVAIDFAAGEGAAVGGVEGPPGGDPAGDERVDRERPAGDEQVPAQQVDPREGEVFGPDHQRHEEVPQDGRDGGDEEEEDHHDAVDREQPVVDLGLEQVPLRRGQLEPHQRGRGPADEEEDRDRDHVEDRDPLVVQRQQPRPDAEPGVQVRRPRVEGGDVRDGGHTSTARGEGRRGDRETRRKTKRVRQKPRPVAAFRPPPFS